MDAPNAFVAHSFVPAEQSHTTAKSFMHKYKPIQDSFPSRININIVSFILNTYFSRLSHSSNLKSAYQLHYPIVRRKMALQLTISEDLATYLLILWSISTLAMSTSMSVFTWIMSKQTIAMSNATQSAKVELVRTIEDTIARVISAADAQRATNSPRSGVASIFNPSSVMGDHAQRVPTTPGTPLSIKYIGGMFNSPLTGAATPLSDTLSQRLQKFGEISRISPAPRPRSAPDLNSLVGRLNGIVSVHG